MAILIRSKDNISGVHFNNTEIKLSQLADDATYVLRHVDSLDPLLRFLDIFSAWSGRKINRAKSAILSSKDPDRLGQFYSNIPVVSKVNILGIWFFRDGSVQDPGYRTSTAGTSSLSSRESRPFVILGPSNRSLSRVRARGRVQPLRPLFLSGLFGPFSMSVLVSKLSGPPCPNGSTRLRTLNSKMSLPSTSSWVSPSWHPMQGRSTLYIICQVLHL